MYVFDVVCLGYLVLLLYTREYILRLEWSSDRVYCWNIYIFVFFFFAVDFMRKLKMEKNTRELDFRVAQNIEHRYYRIE